MYQYSIIRITYGFDTERKTGKGGNYRGKRLCKQSGYKAEDAYNARVQVQHTERDERIMLMQRKHQTVVYRLHHTMSWRRGIYRTDAPESQERWGARAAAIYETAEREQSERRRGGRESANEGEGVGIFAQGLPIGRQYRGGKRRVGIVAVVSSLCARSRSLAFLSLSLSLYIALSDERINNRVYAALQPALYTTKRDYYIYIYTHTSASKSRYIDLYIELEL